MMVRILTTVFALSVAVLATPAPARPSQPQTQGQNPSDGPAPRTPPQTTTPATPSEAPPAAQPATDPAAKRQAQSVADTDHGTAILLLEHVQKVLDDAANSGTVKVTIDRGVLDEIRAELTQVRRSLQQ